MEKNIRSALTEMIMTRTDDLRGDFMLENKKYTEAADCTAELIKRIAKVIPDEFKNLIEELDNACCEEQAIAEDIMYEQGLKDGMELNSILGIDRYKVAS